jgi:hypothetical protein
MSFSGAQHAAESHPSDHQSMRAAVALDEPIGALKMDKKSLTHKTLSAGHSTNNLDGRGKNTHTAQNCALNSRLLSKERKACA